MPCVAAWLAAVGLGLVAAAPTPSLPYQVQLGVPTFVLYGNETGVPTFPDQSTLVLNFTDVLRGYNAFSQTLLIIQGPSLADVLSPPFKPVTATWDLEAAVVDPNNSSFVRGFVHHENGWYYNGDYKYNGYITYVESRDGGLSFQPYPNTGNLSDSVTLLSAGPQGIGGPTNTGTGPQWVVTVGAYHYMYYQDAFALDPVTGAPGMAYTVARTSVSDGGRPGTWFKYLGGAWASPGLGGNSTALPGLQGAKMVWLQEAGLWLAVAYSGGMSVSSDGLTWALLPSLATPQLPPAQPLAQYYPYADYVTYQSWVPGYGGNVLYPQDTLKLFYCFVPAGDNPWHNATRFLATVPVSLLPVATPPYVIFSLSNYVPQEPSLPRPTGTSTAAPALDTDDHWASLAPVDVRPGVSPWDYGWHIGYTLSSPADWPSGDVVPIVDCYLVEAQDHFGALVGECQNPSASTAPPGTKALLGTLGYLLAVNTTEVPGYQLMALYRCFNAGEADYWVQGLYPCTNDPPAPGERLLGYALWSNEDGAPGRRDVHKRMGSRR